MAVGSEVYLAGVKFDPSLISGDNTSNYVNKRVEQNRRELLEKAAKYGKDYKEIVHRLHNKKKKTRNTSMLEYTEQMKTLQYNRVFVPSQSTVHTYYSRRSLEVRHLPRDKSLPKIARSLDGGNQQLDRTSICSPKSIVSKSNSLPSGSASKRRSETKNGFKLKFDITTDTTVRKDSPVSTTKIKVVSKGWVSPETSGSRKVNAFTGNHSGIMKVGSGSSNGKTVTIKLPGIDKDEHKSDNGLLLTLEPELVDSKDYESNRSTFDESSDYEIDVPSTSIPIVDAEDLKAKRREEHTRTLLREAVEKLKEIDEKYENGPQLVIPKLKKKKRLNLSNSLDSIPESLAESEKQESTVFRRKKYFPSPNMMRTRRTTVVVKPSLDVIPEFTSKRDVYDENNNINVNVNTNTGNAFKGGKLNSKNATGFLDENNKNTTELSSSMGLSLQSHHKQHIVSAKIEDDFKSKRLHYGSKFGIKHKKLKFLKAY